MIKLLLGIHFFIPFLAALYANPGVELNTQPNRFPEEPRESFSYISGYKYQLHQDYFHTLKFDSGITAKLDFIELKGRCLTLRKGYSWDGASGPALDTKNFMRGSAIHDALYLLMAHGFLKQSKFKDLSDREFIQILKKDGMPLLRRIYVHQAVKHFGLKGSSKRGTKRIHYASEKSKLKQAVQKISRAFTQNKVRRNPSQYSSLSFADDLKGPLRSP